MVTILGALLGFGSSIFPEVLKFFQDLKDKKHELAAMELQLKLMDKRSELAIEERKVDGEMTNKMLEFQAELASVKQSHKPMTLTGVSWIDGLRGSVRPLVTYWFMSLYSFHKFAAYQESGVIWTTNDWALLATVIGFWFGDRIRKYMHADNK